MASVSKTANDALQAKVSAIQAGYRPVACQGAVYETLLTTVADTVGATRRQTPLVNAGYAFRVATVCRQIQAFVSFHHQTQTTCQKLQLVMLGAGLDVTGLWSLALDESSMDIHVVEVDTIDICAAKRETLLQLGYVKASTDTSKQDGGAIVLEGRPSKYYTTSSRSSYTLIAADLRDMDAIRESLSFLDTSVPTMIVSELVLTYLGDAHRDELLRWCATTLCTNSGSCLMAYEPLLPKDTHHSSIEAYKRFYFSQFTNKLDRGKAPEQHDSGCNVFSPLGGSCREVERRLQTLGFDRSCVAIAGKVAAATSKAGVDLRSKELFDEHAALALHLRSYALLCGFTANADPLLRHTLCPWSFDVPLRTLRLAAGVNVWLTNVAIQDESQIRHLFQQTYQHIVDNGSVRKMVKSALKTDLALTVPGNLEKESSIGARFRDVQGTFLVAVRCEQGTADGDSARRVVVGGIGVRKCNSREASIRGRPNTYEISRLFVDPSARGGGIGRELFEAVEDFIRRTGKTRGNYNIVATTPTILAQANKFYPSRGFDVSGEVAVGALLMRTFVKSVSAFV